MGVVFYLQVPKKDCFIKFGLLAKFSYFLKKNPSGYKRSIDI